MSLAAALLLAAALGAEARLETGLRVEARAHRAEPAATPAEERALDLAATPRVGLEARAGAFSLLAGYTPRFAVSDVGPDALTEVLHVGELRLGWRPGATAALALFGTGSAGRTDLVAWDVPGGAGTGSDPTSPTTIATTRRVKLENLRAGAELRLAPSRRLELGLAGSWFQGGGADEQSRATNPVVRGVSASGDLRWNVTRRDALGIGLAGEQARVAQLRTDSVWASALATWRRRLSPRAEASAGAGAVVLESRLPAPASTGRTTERQTEPAAELGLSWAAAPGVATEGAEPAAEPSRGTAGELGARLGASVDRLTGLAVPSLDARALVRWPLGARLTLHAQGAGTLTWPRAGRTRTGHLSAGADLRLATWATLDAGAFVTRQWSEVPGVPRVDVWGGLVGLTLTPRPIGR